MKPSPDAQTYRIVTLGCKANVYDSRRLAEALDSLGYREAAEGESPEVCVLNTCTVTATADRKSRQWAARLARQNPGGRVFVTGCCASAAPSELRQVAGVAGVYGRGQWDELLQAVNGAAHGPRPRLLDGDFGIRSFGGRARAFLKIQEGCDSFCSYCILPFVRGGPRSHPLPQVRAEAERLAASGFREIVLTGIHVGLYGRDLEGLPTVADAVLAVAETPGVERVRLSSIEAREVTEELLDAMRHPAVCPHLHLPLQSGDAQVLRRMNRPYTPEEFLRVVDLARERLDRPAVTADVMVGFPGETEQQFASTLAVCRRARFSRTHVFPFSPRPGTAAAEMPDRVAPEVVGERSRRVRDVARQLAVEWAEGFVGQTVRVLFERRTRSGLLTGYTDRYVRLAAPGASALVGHVEHVRCVARNGTALSGRLAVLP
jgi:threonylcarbamoyladenosine tRNA methylthiotransferase MtaB